MQKLKLQYMIKSILSGILVFVTATAMAQVHTQIIGDSVHMRSNTGTTELILENSTKNVNGFLFNKGNGRTEFRRGMTRLNDSICIIGADTLNLFSAGNAWRLTGNAGINPTINFLGTVDNNRLVLKTNNQQRLSILPDGTVNIGTNDTASQPLFRVYPNGDFTAKAKNNLTGNVFGPNNGIRYDTKYGLFEVGTGNNFDTALSVTCCGSLLKSGIIINSDFLNTFKGHIHDAIIAGDNITIDTAGNLTWGSLMGESHYINGGISKSMVSGWGMNVNNGGFISNSVISGISHQFFKPVGYSSISGYGHSAQDTAFYSLVSGIAHKYGGTGQLLSGSTLVNRTPMGTTLGNSNVDFSTLPYTGLKGVQLSSIANLDRYPIFAIGNSRYYNNPSFRSNAMTVLYNGRTQINTMGYDSNLVENDVIPKAALEIVSKNSGILIPRLTTTQRNGIVSGDLHNGLLLYNTDSSKFQFYNGSTWKTISDNGGGSNGGVNYSVQSLTDGSTITLNAANGINGAVTLGGTGRALSITNPVAGYEYHIKIAQDGTGSRTIGTWPANTLWPSGVPPVLSTVASAIDLVTLYYDGSNYFGDHKLLFKPPSNNVSIYSFDGKTGFAATTHNLTNVPAGALLVLTTSAGSSQTNNIGISSTPSLTWTKRVDASGSSSGDAEIYTAVYTAGGSIGVSSNWGNQAQSSVCYTIINQESSLGGATALGVSGTAPNVSITTTRANSIILAVTSDWNAVDGNVHTYRNSPIETQYFFSLGNVTSYYYYKLAPTATSYSMGLTVPSTQSSGTALIEIRGN
jgi:hypothetical protein